MLCPINGVEQEFLAFIDPQSTTCSVDLILLDTDRAPRHRVNIRLHNALVERDATRPQVYHIRNGYYYEISPDGQPMCDIHFDVAGNPVPDSPGVYRCNGYVNLEVTQFDTQLGLLRVKINTGGTS